MLELKPLSPEAVPSALDRAGRYRLLNEPIHAESICRDILRVDPDHQEALTMLLLALSDQFNQRLGEKFSESLEVVARLTDEYRRIYYRGLVYERRAHAHLRQAGPGSGHLAYDWFRQAMDCYTAAEDLRPAGNDDAILRWNSCARIVERHPEARPAPEDDFTPMLE